VHPANVEAVVWISQLKSLLALCFALTALLLFRNRPIWAGLPFVLGLLSKASAAFALPFAAVMVWSWLRARRDTRRHVLS
jgi:predicted membrane-bound dolichyl-phosphate-mannose-protein mannosyltransferase